MDTGPGDQRSRGRETQLVSRSYVISCSVHATSHVPFTRHPGMLLAGIQCLALDLKTLDACLRRHDVDAFKVITMCTLCIWFHVIPAEAGIS